MFRRLVDTDIKKVINAIKTFRNTGNGQLSSFLAVSRNSLTRWTYYHNSAT